MNTDQFFSSLLLNAPIFVGKIFIVTLLFIHFLFSLLLIRQTKLMLNVVEAKISPIIRIISIFHALFSLYVLISSALLFHF